MANGCKSASIPPPILPVHAIQSPVEVPFAVKRQSLQHPGHHSNGTSGRHDNTRGEAVKQRVFEGLSTPGW